mmetsp:Transcript_7216/g.8692  ORF Transcript_7216/g.8692 Transcript_7216/m.8692 type:complete len:393 (+) Transcript_7216:242-1420(+)
MDRSGNGTCPTDVEFSDDEIAGALSKIIQCCAKDREDEKCEMVIWSEKPNVVQESIDLQNLDRYLSDNIDAFKAEGGVVLLIYSAVATRGPKKVREDISSGLGEPHLVIGHNWFCTSELMSLLMRGVACGNVGAYSIDGTYQDFSVPTKIGLLSMGEYEGTPMADPFKTPALPVWILHSGSHFTTIFDERGAKADASGSQPPSYLIHWNGLPPEGPRLSKVQIAAKQVAKKQPKIRKEVYYKPLPGEIEDVIQANSDDKKKMPNDWTTWTYEVILAVDDPTVKGAERPSDLPADIYSQGREPVGRWRCASCYRRRFETGLFFFNDADDENCTQCKKSKADAGWSIWLPYADLPKSWQEKLTTRHAPKLVSILRTKWPDCVITSPSLKDIPLV